MTSTREDEAYRRRAVLTALERVLDPPQARQAFCLWARDYSHQPGFALQEYTRALATRLPLGTRRKDLYRELVNCMFLPAAELAPDPGRPAEGECDEAAPAPSGQTPPARTGPALARAQAMDDVFAALFRELLAALRSEAPPAIENRLQGLRLRLSEMGLGGRAADALRGWLMRPEGACPHPLEQHQQQRLIHGLYVIGCEALGPVVTDRLLDGAVRRTEGTPPARRFPPRELL